MLPMGVNGPVVVLMVYIDTSLELEFATYANLPVGSTATEAGPVPAGSDPIGAKVPVVGMMLYMDTLPVN